MITSIHTLIYSEDPPATRAFLRDVLGWPHVEHPESEEGWLIFRSGPSELGVHPTAGTWEGAEFSGEINDEGFGLVAMLELPGAGQILLYEPHHPTAYAL
jgi:catechol 2,3-dioxygenase-like lactoylglutathione lyase family enzyme